MAAGRKAGKSGRAVRVAGGSGKTAEKHHAQDRERAGGAGQHADPDNQRRKSREAGLLLRAAEMFDLPGEVVAGVARIEITGGREILIENHAGILEYGPSEIDVNSSGVIIRIRGDELEIRAMTQSELSIRGLVLSVEFVY